MDDDEMCRRFAEQDGYTEGLADEWPSEDRISLAGAAASDEHDTYHVPTHLITLQREGDTLHVSAYARLSMVFIVSVPRVGPFGNEVGSVREIPVGWRDMRSAETFLAYVNACARSYELMGWQRA